MDTLKGYNWRWHTIPEAWEWLVKNEYATKDEDAEAHGNSSALNVISNRVDKNIFRFSTCFSA